MFHKDSALSTSSKADSKFITRENDISRAFKESMMMDEVKDDAWKGIINSQGFSESVANSYINMGTTNANYDAFNMTSRYGVNESNIIPFCTMLQQKPSMDMLNKVEAAFKTSTPGWIAAFFGENKFRDHQNLNTIARFYGLGYITNLGNRLGQDESIVDRTILIEKLFGSLFQSMIVGSVNAQWDSLDYNMYVIKAFIGDGSFLTLLCNILKEPSPIINWKTREIVCKIFVVILSSKPEYNTGLENMFSIIGDFELSFFLNHVFDFVEAWIPVYLKTIKEEYALYNINQVEKRKRDDDDDLISKKRTKGYNYEQPTPVTKARPVVNHTPNNKFNTVIGRMSKFSKTIQGSVRKVRKAEVKPTLSDRVIHSASATGYIEEGFTFKFNEFMVLAIHLDGFLKICDCIC